MDDSATGVNALPNFQKVSVVPVNPAGVRSPHRSTGAKAVLLVGSTELELSWTKGWFFRQVVRDLVGLAIG
jgi:hypothetical protein